MFGFVVADRDKLDAAMREHYSAVYCGLCHRLSREYGFSARFTLTYDLAFLILLLSDVNAEEYRCETLRCPVYGKKKKIELNSFSDYAADINLILAYYKVLDDINDEGSPAAAVSAKALCQKAKKAEAKRPSAAIYIRDGLEKLSLAEKNDVLIPDIPAGVFGDIMGSIFAEGTAGYKEEVRNFGFALGRAVYLMDAAVDLRKDIRKCRYNPLIASSSEQVGILLDEVMADVTEQYRLLPSGKDKELIENVLLSGIWTVYENKNNHKKESKGEKRSV